jgi:hypothetical protein
MILHVISSTNKKRRANNYFKAFGSNKLFLFDATDTKSTEAAWAGACGEALSEQRVSCLKPFPIAGPWWGAHLIGHTIIGPPKDDESRDVSEMRTRQIRAWNDTRAYLL